MSEFRVILTSIESECRKIRTGITLNTDTFQVLRLLLLDLQKKNVPVFYIIIEQAIIFKEFDAARLKFTNNSKNDTRS